MDSKLGKARPRQGVAFEEDPGSLEGLMAKKAETSPLRWVTPAIEAASVDGEVVDVVSVLEGLAVVAEAVGEGRVIHERGAFGSLANERSSRPPEAAVPYRWRPTSLLFGYPTST